MLYLLLIHILLAMWVLIDGHRRKIYVIPWALGATLLGPIILPYYIAKHPLKAHASAGGGKGHCLMQGLALLWTLVWVLIDIWGVKAATNQTKNESLEYRLAVISTKGYVGENDPVVDRFRSLLDQLSQNFIEDPQQIAFMSVMVQNKVKVYGKKESLLNIMEGMNQILLPKDSQKRRYSEYAFAYVDLRNKGLTHQEAIERLQATVSGY